MQVILRPIYKNTWAGVKKYKNCFEDITPYLTKSGRVYTGLTEKDRKRFEEKLNIDLSPNSEFWINYFIRTTSKDLYLYTEDPEDELRYYFLKNHKRVKSSLTERKPGADFVLINETEEARKMNVESRAKRTALSEFDKLSPEDIKKALRIFGYNGDRLSNEIAENRLYQIVEKNPRAFLSKWVRNKNRDLEAIIERAIGKNIIRRNKNIYKYGTEIIGRTMEEAVNFLRDPKNQDFRLAIVNELEGKSTIDDTEKVVSKKVDIEEDEPTLEDNLLKEVNVSEDAVDLSSNPKKPSKLNVK